MIQELEIQNNHIKDGNKKLKAIIKKVPEEKWQLKREIRILVRKEKKCHQKRQHTQMRNKRLNKGKVS